MMMSRGSDGRQGQGVTQKEAKEGGKGRRLRKAKERERDEGIKVKYGERTDRQGRAGAHANTYLSSHYPMLMVCNFVGVFLIPEVYEGESSEVGGVDNSSSIVRKRIILLRMT